MCKVELLSLDKLDFPKLCAHVAQYRIKCGISVENHQSWWDQYLQDLGASVANYSSAEWSVE